MRFLSYLVTLLISFLIAACGGGGGSPGLTPGGQGPTPPPVQPLFTTAPADLTLTIGSAQNFTVGGGKAPYTATSNNSAVAIPAIADTALTLGGVSPGSATVTLRDAAGATTSVGITVRPSRALFTTAPSSINIAIGGSAQTYQVGGGVGPYVVGNSNSSALSAVLNGTNLTLTGLAGGDANLVILDSVGGVLNVAVKVPTSAALALFTTAPSAVTTSKGTSTTYGIGGGLAPYTVTSNNTGVITVSQGDNTFTINGVANGSGILVVRDSAGGTPVQIAVTVSAAQLTLNPVSVNAFIGDTVYSTISGGTAPYNVVEGFPDAADVDVGTLSGTTFVANPSGNILRVLVKQVVATDVILVRDSTGNAVSFTLTATAGTNIISLAPSSLTIGEESLGPIRLVLRGAVGVTNIFSSNPNLITVATPVTGTVAGTAVTITKTPQEVCTTGKVTITAIDSTGAKAETLVTVEDHGNNPDPCPPIVPTP